MIKDQYRGKFISVVIQPKMKDNEFWLSVKSDEEIEKKLKDNFFPTSKDIKLAFENIEVLTVNKKKLKIGHLELKLVRYLKFRIINVT